MSKSPIKMLILLGVLIVGVVLISGCVQEKAPTKSPEKSELSDLSEKCIFAKEKPSYMRAKEAVGAYIKKRKEPKSELCLVSEDGYRLNQYGIKCIATPQGNVFYESFVTVQNVNNLKDSYEYICLGGYVGGECMIEGRLDELIAQGFQDVPVVGVYPSLAESCD